MSILDSFKECFGVNIEIQSKETFSYLEIKCSCTELILPQLECINSLKGLISNRDKYYIYVECYGNEIVKCSGEFDIGEFLQRLKESIEDPEDDRYKIEFKIDKIQENGNISIYDYKLFSEYINELSLEAILENFNSLISEKDYLYFRNKEESGGNSNSIYFLLEDDCSNRIINRKGNIERRNQLSSYLNASEFEFSADDFILINQTQNELINRVFYKLSIIYSLIGISDISSIKDNKVKYIINGYKRIDCQFDYKCDFINSLSEYVKIYNWIYNEGNSVNSCVDKVGIARNVITASTNLNKLYEPSQGLFNSICSAHSVYLKENVKEYLEAKGKVNDFIFEFTQKINDVSNEIGKSLKSNLLGVGTFYITVVIMNILSDNRLENILTKDITVLSLAIWVLSIIYLVYSIIEVIFEVKRLEEQYFRVKNSYDGILNNEDINNIFKNDEYMKMDKKRVKRKVVLYSIIWIFFIIIMIISIYNLGYQHVHEILKGLLKYFHY